MSNPNQNTLYQEEDEISLKDLILKIQEYFWVVLRKWWLVALITIPIVLYHFYQAYTTPIVYPATLTFMLNEDEGGGMGGLSAILGQFGFGGGRKGKYNVKKLLELSKTRRIVQLALFEKIDFNNKTDYLANHIILAYDYHEKWVESEIGLKDFLFSHDSIPAFNRAENTVLKILHGRVIGSPSTEGLMSTSIDDDSGIMSISAKANSEQLSILLAELIYKKLSNFYIDKTIEKQQRTYQLFKSKADSIQQALNNAQYRLLKFKDTNRALSLRQYEAEEIRLQQETKKLILAYGEVYKNLEVADFSLKSATPFVQVIDLPIPPIRGKGSSKLVAIIKGGIIGVILGITIVLGVYIFQQIMNEE